MLPFNALPTVLLIEPDATTAELYRRELSREFRMLAAGTIEQALRLIAEETPCIVVFEPMGAGGDPGRVCESLAERKPGGRVPLILCTVADDRKLSRELGAARHLIKPVLPSVLAAALRQFACRVQHLQGGQK